MIRAIENSAVAKLEKLVLEGCQAWWNNDATVDLFCNMVKTKNICTLELQENKCNATASKKLLESLKGTTTL